MQFPQRRHELEEFVEGELLEIAESLVGPTDEDLKAAKDYFPVFFGGTFPTLGLAVTRTQAQSRSMDKRDRPGILVAEVKIFHPALPNMAYRTSPLQRGEDKTGPAKRLTRRLRGLFLEAVFAAPIGKYIDALDSRGSSKDELGAPVAEETYKSILWVDLTELRVNVP